ncbi:MAG TPA: nucleotidyltransferase family protein [Polyangiaceae bacterium]|nr:nucleotidyltransferase family protein [Polyangiaceae bacterium]
MRRDEVLAILQAHREDLRRLGVKSLSLFGSMARDEARPDSDIDLLVEFADPATFDAFMDLKFYLEDLLGRRIDLVTSKALKPRIRPSVEREAILVA